MQLCQAALIDSTTGTYAAFQGAAPSEIMQLYAAEDAVATSGNVT
jgi:hypothetical protein